MEETFGSTCHGAGRVKSRSAAKKSISGADVARELTAKGIAFQVANISSLSEEASAVYKDVADVMRITDAAGISPKVVKARPIGVIKG
jgi:tRNA-splicing ligase RtcB